MMTKLPSRREDPTPFGQRLLEREGNARSSHAASCAEGGQPLRALRRLGLGMLLLATITGTPMHAAPILYTFVFETQAPGKPVPTGGFGYDRSTGLFSNFVVVHDGASYDFTAMLNMYGGEARLPFELGFLAQNLIDGYGPLGPELSHWYAGPEGFYGFEWRTPAQDFLTLDITLGAPASPISSAPEAFAGTWRTIETTAEVPEPGTLGMTAVAGAAGAWALRRRARAARRMGQAFAA